MNEGRSHQQRGHETEARVTAELVELGFGVSSPVFGNERYDLILDRNGQLDRVQVKTAYEHHEKDGIVVVEFDTTVYTSTGEPQRKYYESDEIDSYIVYCPSRDTTLFVPFEVAPRTQMNFSFKQPSEYNPTNRERMNFADEYQLSSQLA